MFGAAVIGCFVISLSISCESGASAASFVVIMPTTRPRSSIRGKQTRRHASINPENPHSFRQAASFQRSAVSDDILYQHNFLSDKPIEHRSINHGRYGIGIMLA